MSMHKCASYVLKYTKALAHIIIEEPISLSTQKLQAHKVSFYVG